MYQQERDLGPRISDEECRSLIDKMMKTKKPPEFSLIPELKRYITQEMRIAASHCDYEYGTKLEQADALISRFVERDISSKERRDRHQKLEKKLANVKGQMDDLNAKYDSWIGKCREDQDTRVAALEQQHKRQLADFEAKWADPVFLSQFSKPSTTLISLRNSEQTLAMSRMFQRARAVKADADKIEKEDIEEARRRAVVIMKNEYERIDARQKREMECLLEYTKNRVDLLEMDREKAVAPLEQIYERLRVSGDVPKNRGFSSSVVPAPRPLRRFPTDRGEKKPLALNMTALPVRQFIPPKLGAARAKRAK
jgi:hypothetical protein